MRKILICAIFSCFPAFLLGCKGEVMKKPLKHDFVEFVRSNQVGYPHWQWQDVPEEVIDGGRVVGCTCWVQIWWTDLNEDGRVNLRDYAILQREHKRILK